MRVLLLYLLKCLYLSPSKISGYFLNLLKVEWMSVCGVLVKKTPGTISVPLKCNKAQVFPCSVQGASRYLFSALHKHSSLNCGLYK